LVVVGGVDIWFDYEEIGIKHGGSLSWGLEWFGR